MHRETSTELGIKCSCLKIHILYNRGTIIPYRKRAFSVLAISAILCFVRHNSAVDFDLRHQRNNTCSSCDNGSSRSKKPVALSYGPTDKVHRLLVHDARRRGQWGVSTDPLLHLRSISMHFLARQRYRRIAREMASFRILGRLIHSASFQKILRLFDSYRHWKLLVR